MLSSLLAPTVQATCKLHDISEEEGGVVESWWTGRALLHVFWIGKTGSHRISHVQSIPAREERREGNNHSCITIPSLSSASLRRLKRFCVDRLKSEGWTCVECSPETSARCCSGGLGTSGDFLLSLILGWDSVRSWQIGPGRYCASPVFSPGFRGLFLRRSRSPSSLLFIVFVRNLDKRLKRIAPFSVENTISGVEAESDRSARLSHSDPLQFQVIMPSRL